MSRILIAEDEARIASFLEKGLRANGFATTVASDGHEAVRPGRLRRASTSSSSTSAFPDGTASTCWASCAGAARSSRS